jgi:hypothetical protein
MPPIVEPSKQNAVYSVADFSGKAFKKNKPNRSSFPYMKRLTAITLILLLFERRIPVIVVSVIVFISTITLLISFFRKNTDETK